MGDSPKPRVALAGVTRELRFTEGTSNKFWRISLEGPAHHITFGRVGTAGQSQTKQFASAEEAELAFGKLIAEKTRKGYLEYTSDAAVEPPAPEHQSNAGPQSKTATARSTSPTASVSASAPAASQPQPAPTRENLDAPPREIALEPDDWRWASWRKIPPRTRPEPAPFDRARALERIRKVKAHSYGWEWDWSRVGIEPSLTPEEAHFWFAAMTSPFKEMSRNRKKITPADLARSLESATFSGAPSASEAYEALEEYTYLPAELLSVLANLFSVEAILERALERDAAGRQNKQHAFVSKDIIASGFRTHLLPYLSDEQRRAMGERLRPELDPASWTATLGSYDRPPLAFFLAAALGMGHELRPIVESWPDDAYTNPAETWKAHYHRPLGVVFGLDDPGLVEAHTRRLGLVLTTPEYVRAWLAHTEYSALDWVRASVQATSNKEEAASRLDVLALVKAPEAAAPMLELVLASKAPRGAREWLDRHPEHAIEGLLPLAANRGKLSDAAVEFLLTLRRRGWEPFMRAAVERLPAETADRVRAAVLERNDPTHTPFDDATTPAPLRDALAETARRKAKPPQWVAIEGLPPIVFGERCLNDEQVNLLLTALQLAKPDAIPPLVPAVKAHADPASCDAFAWRLFEQWLADGAPSREGWALRAVGLLGGDASVLKLAPMIRAWPGESQHARAVAGLDVLRAVGTDTALMQINGIAQKVPFKGLKNRAAECMEEIARARGLTRAQLEDRVVPDCGLDERGSRVFDFGPRQFEFLLGADMKPMVREPGAKPRPDLPKPGARDDAALAARAIADWKLIKKQIGEVVKIQATRLEQAMVTGRRWPREEFESLLVGHPLMGHLVRLLVWGAYDGEGQLQATFRVTEDRAFAGERDEVFDLGSSIEVGLAHPLALASQQRSAWGEILADYEIVPPFAQLGRPLHGLEPGEANEKEITRFKALAIPATSLVFTLEKLGWVRGIPQDAGVFFEHSKPFYGADVTAIVQYEGVPVGYMEGWDDQHVERCFFLSGIYTPEMYPEHKNAVPLGHVDSIVISEVLADLTAIAARGK